MPTWTKYNATIWWYCLEGELAQASISYRANRFHAFVVKTEAGKSFATLNQAKRWAERKIKKGK